MMGRAPMANKCALSNPPRPRITVSNTCTLLSTSNPRPRRPMPEGPGRPSPYCSTKAATPFWKSLKAFGPVLRSSGGAEARMAKVERLSISVRE